MLKKLFKNKRLCFILAVFALFGVVIANGIFKASSLKQALRLLSDCFFSAGVLLLGFAGLIFCARGGCFDMLLFASRRLLSRWGFGRKRIKYYDHISNKKPIKTNSPYHILLGAVLVFSAAVFLVIEKSL